MCSRVLLPQTPPWRAVDGDPYQLTPSRTEPQVLASAHPSCSVDPSSWGSWATKPTPKDQGGGGTPTACRAGSLDLVSGPVNTQSYIIHQASLQDPRITTLSHLTPLPELITSWQGSFWTWPHPQPCARSLVHLGHHEAEGLGSGLSVCGCHSFLPTPSLAEGGAPHAAVPAGPVGLRSLLCLLASSIFLPVLAASVAPSGLAALPAWTCP